MRTEKRQVIKTKCLNPYRLKSNETSSPKNKID